MMKDRYLLPPRRPECDPGTHKVEDTSDQHGDTTPGTLHSEPSFLDMFLLYPSHKSISSDPNSASLRKQKVYLPRTTSQFPQSPLSFFPGMKKFSNICWCWVFSSYLWTVSLCVPGWPWTFDPSASGSWRWLWLYHLTQGLQCKLLILWFSLCIV